ncbi:MAG: hypothetical protein OXQ28_11280 [Acidobacteriota bacterium]|nr:hypothetical protein [Acidobacteriota bacterium]
MFSRTWMAVLAGSLALWGMSRLGGVSLSDPGGGAPPVPPSDSSVAAAEAVSALAACLEDIAALDPHAAAGSDVLPVAGRYGRWCRPLLDGEAFDAFSVVYGERSRVVVLAILEREQRLAAELAADPRRGTLAPDVIWAAALRRAASDVRAFEVELLAWFDAWSPVRGDGAAAGRAGDVAAVGG